MDCIKQKITVSFLLKTAWGYYVETTNGICCGVQNRYLKGHEIKRGDEILLHAVRFNPNTDKIIGIDLNGKPISLDTQDEVESKWLAEKQSFEASKSTDFLSQKENLDIRFSSLPELLQHRIALFRKFDDNFRKNEENYESLVVLAAYQIYRLCHNPFDIMNFYFADVARKEQIAPVLREYSFSDNQLACACTLARFLNKDACSMDINAPYHVQLLHSGVMNFSNAALPFSGPRCTPRQEYITKYLVEL